MATDLVGRPVLVTDYSKAVLKLMVGHDGPIRRVALSRLITTAVTRNQPKPSYEALSALAVQYTFPDVARPVRLQQFEVSMTYIDEDGDIITIGTDEELADALDQYITRQPPVLRVKAIVKESDSGANDGSKVEAGAQVKAPASTIPPQDKGYDAELKEAEQRSVQDDDAEEKTNEEASQDCIPEGFDPNFIHGKHTCDMCLKTPIIGIRHHAINLPDYDLCHRCFGNYKGTDIVFEPVELDRDRPWQHRWARRRARRPHCAGGHPGHFRQFQGGRRGCQRRRWQQGAGMDEALSEAIRRSLLDVNKERQEALAKEEEKKEVKVNVEEKAGGNETKAVAETLVKEEEPEIVVAEVLEEEPPEPSAPPAEEDEDKKPNATDAETKPIPDKQVKEAFATASKSESFASAAAGSGEIAEAIGITLDHCAEAIDAIVTEFEKTPQGGISRSVSVDSDDGGSLRSSSQKLASVVAVAVDVAGVAASVASDVARTFQRQQNQESGGMREETMDDDVSAMTSSVPSLAAAPPDGVELPAAPVTKLLIPEPREEQEQPTEVSDSGAKATKSANSSPATVTDLVEEDDKDDFEWQVVDEDEQVSGDEMLARAAQLLGSAIFHSDMSNPDTKEVKAEETQCS